MIKVYLTGIYNNLLFTTEGTTDDCFVLLTSAAQDRITAPGRKQLNTHPIHINTIGWSKPQYTKQYTGNTQDMTCTINNLRHKFS